VVRGKHPWMGFLQINNTDFCGATLIDKLWALTAAHCVHGVDAGDVRLKFDSRNISEAANEGFEREVETIIVHPDFDSIKRINDIALIALQESVEGFSPLKLGSKPVAQKGHVLGWGRTETDKQSEILLMAELILLEIQSCEYLDATLNAQNQICASKPNMAVDTCEGDSGGPLIVNINDTHPVQVGILSFGSENCTNGPSIYTNITAFQEFIEKETPARFLDESCSCPRPSSLFTSKCACPGDENWAPASAAPSLTILASLFLLSWLLLS